MIIDAVLAILLLVTLFDSYRQGLLKILVKIAGVFISWVVAGILARQLQGLVAQTWIIPFLQDQVKELTELGALVGDAMEAAAESIAYGMVYLLIFLLLQIVFQILMHTLNFVNRIPVVGTLNHIGGLILGLVWYFVVLFTVAFILFRILPEDTRDSIGLSDTVVKESLFLNSLAEAIED